MTTDRLGMRIKRIREYRKLSCDEVANKIGVHKSTLSRWEQGITEKMPAKALFDLAKVLEVDTGYLFEGIAQKQQQGLQIPIYASIVSSAPANIRENIIGWEDVPSSFTLHDQVFFGLKIADNQMTPEYQVGDIVICHKTTAYESGDDCIVQMRDKPARLRRVIDSDLGIIIKPLNTEYDPQFISKQDMQVLSFKIIGVVIELRRKIQTSIDILHTITGENIDL